MKKGTKLIPSITLEKWYQKEIRALVLAMEKATLAELSSATRHKGGTLDKEPEHVPVEFQTKAKDLRYKFDALFLKYGEKMAAEFVERQIRFSSNSFVRSIKTMLTKTDNQFLLQGHVMTLRNEAFITDMVKENVSLIKSISSQYFDRIEKEITTSLAGKSQYKSIYEAIKGIGGMSERRAKFIARDQNSKIYSQLTVENMRTAGIAKMMWLHSGGGKQPREYHKRTWDGKSDPPNGLNRYVFDVNARPIADPETGERAFPGELINCFTGDTEVQLSPKIKAAYKRLYKGDLIRLKTKSGNIFSGTRNHPILTPDGWVGLGNISKGDSVVCYNSGVNIRGCVGLNVNIKNPPTRIEQIFNSIFYSGVIRRKLGHIMDFHGDGAKSNVNIVFPAGLLKYGVWQKFRYFSFPKPNILKSFLSGNCFFGKIFIRALHSPDRLMGKLNLISPFRACHFGPFHRFGLALCSSPNSVLSKYSGNYIPRHLKFGSDTVFGLSDDCVFVDDIVCVEVINFSGHVYNLHTVDEWYCVGGSDKNQGVIAHNCRCVAVPVIDV